MRFDEFTKKWALDLKQALNDSLLDYNEFVKDLCGLCSNEYERGVTDTLAAISPQKDQV